MFETSREGSEKTAGTSPPAVPDFASRPGERDRLRDAPAAGRFAEFFAGIGLVREAIEPLGWQCVFANDIAPRKEEMYRRRFSGEHFRLGDIHDLGIGDLPPGLDLVTASFPCIDLSLAGNRAGLAGQHSGTDLAVSGHRDGPVHPAHAAVRGPAGERDGLSHVEGRSGSRRRLPSSGRRRLRHRRVVCRRALVPAPEPPSTVRGGAATRFREVRGAGRILGLRVCVLPPYAGSRQLIPGCPSSTCLCRHRRLRRPTLSFLSLRIFRRMMPAGGPRTVLPPGRRDGAARIAAGSMNCWPESVTGLRRCTVAAGTAARWVNSGPTALRVASEPPRAAAASSSSSIAAAERLGSGR